MGNLRVDNEAHQSGFLKVQRGPPVAAVAAVQELLDRAPDVDAVFAGNDLMALGAMEVLKEAGLRIPEDVAVAGFDDISGSSTAVPALTTVRQPFERISEEMVRLLLAVIKGQRPAAITIPTELVVRESA